MGMYVRYIAPSDSCWTVVSGPIGLEPRLEAADRVSEHFPDSRVQINSSLNINTSEIIM
jgi:hypothetical protein